MPVHTVVDSWSRSPAPTWRARSLGSLALRCLQRDRPQLSLDRHLLQPFLLQRLVFIYQFPKGQKIDERRKAGRALTRLCCPHSQAPGRAGGGAAAAAMRAGEGRQVPDALPLGPPPLGAELPTRPLPRASAVRDVRGYFFFSEK